MAQKIGLVLSGGGARGAYQVGVLKGLAEVLDKNKIKDRPRIYAGVSAGAINAGFMAAYADDFTAATNKLAQLWGYLTSDQIFHSDAVHMGRIAMTWAGELGFGALTGTTPGRALLDTAPLRELLVKNLEFDRIQKCLDEGHLDALSMTAVDYSSSNSITFVQGREGLPTWNKPRRRSEKTMIRADHIMASSAIPMLFPAAPLGGRYYGDGCVRNAHPCAPAIYLGAQKLIVIGVRQRSLGADERNSVSPGQPPSVARVINLLLNAVLLDGVELDVDRMERVNEFVRRVPEELRPSLNLREVTNLMISPSADIGEMAAAKASRLPRIIRYLLKGLGRIEEASEIVSYLLFDPLFCSQLIELGRQDAWHSEEEILRFFTESHPPDQRT